MGKEKGSFRGGKRVLEYKDLVMDVLKGYPRQDVEEAKLYFVDAEGIARLRELQSQYDITAENGAEFSKRAKNEFSKVLKIINPDQPSTQFSVGIRGRHRQIKDQDKVFGEDGKSLENEFKSWKKQYLENMTKEAIHLDLDRHDMDIHEQKVNDKIAAAESELKYILNNRDRLVVRIAGIEHQKSYPYIQYLIDAEDEEGKKHRKKLNEHLSIRAANAFYYIPTYYRDGMTINTFIKHAHHPFGDVFYMHQPIEETDHE